MQSCCRGGGGSSYRCQKGFVKGVKVWMLMGAECPECLTQGCCWCPAKCFSYTACRDQILQQLQQLTLPMSILLPTATELVRNISIHAGTAARLGQPGRTSFHKVAIKILCSEFSLNDFKPFFLMTS